MIFLCIFFQVASKSRVRWEINQLYVLKNKKVAHVYILPDSNYTRCEERQLFFSLIRIAFMEKLHATFPTHIHGCWFDLFIIHSSCKNIRTPTVSDGLSDHKTVIADLKVTTTPAMSKNNVSFTVSRLQH